MIHTKIAFFISPFVALWFVAFPMYAAAESLIASTSEAPVVDENGGSVYQMSQEVVIDEETAVTRFEVYVMQGMGTNGTTLISIFDDIGGNELCSRSYTDTTELFPAYSSPDWISFDCAVTLAAGTYYITIDSITGDDNDEWRWYSDYDVGSYAEGQPYYNTTPISSRDLVFKLYGDVTGGGGGGSATTSNINAYSIVYTDSPVLNLGILFLLFTWFFDIFVRELRRSNHTK